ncbi:MAG: hypothetical protein AB2796_02540 [Candidatus Thiodiazotropha sp.]
MSGPSLATCSAPGTEAALRSPNDWGLRAAGKKKHSKSHYDYKNHINFDPVRILLGNYDPNI